MRKRMRLGFWLLGLMVTGAPLVHANVGREVARDGMLFILMIFPVVILGLRLAKARLSKQRMTWRILKGIGLGLCIVVLTFGQLFDYAFVFALLLVLFYALFRAWQVVRRGEGTKRFAVGAFVVLFSLLAATNYLLSLIPVPSTPWAELFPPGQIRIIVTSEETFLSYGKLDVNKNGVPEYGTLEQLIRAGLLSPHLLDPDPRGVYRYVVVLAGDPARDEKGFFCYASPVHYGETARFGISLVDALRGLRASARRTFASDETGVIRWADLGTSRPVTREEVQKWEKVEW